MFVPQLSGTAPPEAVDAVRPAHAAWLDEQYEKGSFLASWRENPRDGGVVPAVAGERARIEEVAAGDPFVAAGVCTYRIAEFFATRTAPGPARHRQTPG